MKHFIIFAIFFLLSACSSHHGYIQFHDGEALHPSQKAIVQGNYEYRNGSLANEMTRIVEINGIKLPGEWGVAEGANTVSFTPGFYEIKILYVHGDDLIDYYSYITLPVSLRKNCTYQITTAWSSLDKAMVYNLIGTPSTPSGNLECNETFVETQEEELQV